MATKILETNFNNWDYMNRVTWDNATVGSSQILVNAQNWVALTSSNMGSDRSVAWHNVNYSKTDNISLCVTFKISTQGNASWWVVMWTAWGGNPWVGIVYNALTWTVRFAIQGSSWGSQIKTLAAWLWRWLITVWVRFSRTTLKAQWWINWFKWETAAFAEPWNLIESDGTVWMRLGNQYSAAYANFKTFIYKWQLWNGIADYSEFQYQHNAVINWRFNKRPIVKKRTIPNVINDRWLIAAYNGTIINSKAINIAPPSAANANKPTAYDGTCTKVLPTAEWLYFNGASSNIAVTDSNTGPFSICLYIKADTWNTQMVSRWAWDIYFTCGISGNTYWGRVETWTIKTVTTTWTLNAFTFNTVVLTYDWAFMNIYVNWIFNAQTAQTGTVADTGNLNIGSYNNASSWFKWYMKDVRYYNRAISATEVINYHNSFMKPVLVEDFSNYRVWVLNPEWLIKTSWVFRIDVINSVNLSVNGDCNSVFGIWWSVDAWVTWTIVTDWPAGTLLTNCVEYTSAAWGATQRLFNAMKTTSATKRYTYSFWAKSVSWNTTLNMTNFLSSSFTITTSWVKYTFDVSWTASANTRYYLSWAWTFRITWIEVKERNDAMKKYTHYTEITTAWAIGFASQQAYGTWEFDIFNWASASAPTFYFINQAVNNAYGTLRGNSWFAILFSWTTIRVRESASSTAANDFFITWLGYVEAFTWYSVRITRSHFNVFTAYIKWWAYTVWTQITISWSWSSWTNPFTSALYPTSSSSVFESSSTWGKITNIKYTPGILA